MSAKKNEIQQLAAEEKRLRIEEQWLIATLKDIKSQQMSLEIEQLQLSSMTSDKNNFSHSNKTAELMYSDAYQPKLEQMDKVESLVNTGELNLEVDIQFNEQTEANDISEESEYVSD